jgi:hypothetical protein
MSECQKKCCCGKEGKKNPRRVIADANGVANDCEDAAKRQEKISAVPVQGSGESDKHHSLLRDWVVL